MFLIVLILIINFSIALQVNASDSISCWDMSGEKVELEIVNSRINALSQLILQNDHKQPIYLDERTLCHSEIGDHAGVISDATKLIELGEAVPGVYMALANSYAKTGQCIQVLQTLDEGIDLRSDDVSLYTDAAKVSLECGLQNQALNYLKKGIEIGEHKINQYPIGTRIYMPSLEDAKELFNELSKKKT